MDNQEHVLGLESEVSSQLTMTTGNELEILSWQIYILRVQSSILESVRLGKQYDKQIPNVKSH
jgi:hypothetical protein